MEKLLKAVHIETFRGNKFVNKEKEIPPGTIVKGLSINDVTEFF